MLQRSAVVIVHGIGEQRPLDTLLDFAGSGDGKAGLLSQKGDPTPVVNPDTMSEMTYLRRVTVNAEKLVGGTGRASTPPAGSSPQPMNRIVDFYEYYWAYRFRDTTWRHVTQWLSELLGTNRQNISPYWENGHECTSPLRGIEGKIRRLVWVLVAVLGLLTIADLIVLFRPGLRASVASSPLLAQSDHVSLIVAAGLVAIALILLPSLGIAINFLGLVHIAWTVLALVVASAFVAAAATMNWAAFVQEWRWLIALISAAVAVFAGILCRRFSRASRDQTRWVGHVSVVLAISSISVLLGAVISLVAALWETFAPTSALLTAAVPLILSIATVVASGAALRGVGDAARYLSNSPDNVEDREKIRAGLVTLLDRLHQQRDPYTGLHSYDRVVVVGHSLGSVIAYDALRTYWTTATRAIPLPLRTGTGPQAATASEARLKVIDDVETIVAQNPPEHPEQWIPSKRKLQALLRYPSDDPAVANGPRWIVSDLVTVGSPLAHAEMLLAEGKGDLIARKRARLYPSDPPPPRDGDELECRFIVNSFVPPLGRSSRMLSTAPFAAVVWTNIYFSHDMVGGPLKNVLGSGIHDVPLEESPPLLLNFLFRYPHSSYWPRGRKDRSKTLDSRNALRAVLLNPSPVLLITGSTQQIGSFVHWLYRHAATDAMRDSYGGAGVELRILSQNQEDGVRCPAKWVWPGPVPIVDPATAPTISEKAGTLGLGVYYSVYDGRDQPADFETAEVNASAARATPA
ncbi:hypothetical protein [Mycolicibacterium baixiangningiae]|uniref:hypothetical protein n=1 Tax=Mycolicibacterium baixiangningiae TaxID=2761578 RepID=UPI0018677353|nr:hypothetical protein [Mycolicibacterium baixiangningiae]